ncbi:hypothetical protein GCM10020219_062360 [Nonomuraea dietziae]
MFPELQVPQAPLPVLLHGPQAVPQQNQDTSPRTGPSKSMGGGSVGWLRAMRVLLGGLWRSPDEGAAVLKLSDLIYE